MDKLTQSQLKGLSEFLNTVAAAWFSAGAISPLFVKNEEFGRIIFLAGIEIFMAVVFLELSLSLLRRVKI